MKRDLDPVALEAAIAHARSGIPYGLDGDILISAAIRTYQKTECKPMEDAPTCGRVFEAWDIKREAWRALAYWNGMNGKIHPPIWKDQSSLTRYSESLIETLFLCWREQRKPNWVKV